MNPLDIFNQFLQSAWASTPMGKGFTWVPEKGRFFDVSDPAEARQLFQEYPGKGKLYLAATTKDVKEPGAGLLAGLEKVVASGITRPAVGGYAGPPWELDASAPTRSKKKAMQIKKKYKQDSVIAISEDGTVDWDA